MDRRLHIIITSEQGRARTFVVPKDIIKKLLTVVGFFCVVGIVATVAYSINNPSASLPPDLASESASQHRPQLSDAYGELSRRSQAIESILSTLDIPTPPATPGKDSGGPFTSLPEGTYHDLILKVDQEINTIRPLPLGYPVQATGLSSTFGSRLDPLNGEEAFHEGIDLRGNPGAIIKATADGQVVEQGYNDDYGWYVLLKHDNSYTTLYAHNQKLLIGPGARVARGQTIALLGNTGRSTGPHLHYEIRRHNRPINPAKYMNISKLLSYSVG
ncbi:MAG: M23 family metallopeptidase [Desulfobulbaceae bacterium]|nr:M23 family metallopeptidase [Desulfobulbaceae bacterium]